MVVAAVAIPQCVIFLAIFAAAKFIFPLTTPDMIADFKACGGFLLLATGFRIAKIHNFPVADMIPAMVLVMPVSWFWGMWWCRCCKKSGCEKVHYSKFKVSKAILGSLFMSR